MKVNRLIQELIYIRADSCNDYKGHINKKGWIVQNAQRTPGYGDTV